MTLGVAVVHVPEHYPQPPRGGACVNEYALFDAAADRLDTGGNGERAKRHPDVAHAKAICRSCPVRDACLTWALVSGQRYGVLGGMSPQERERLVKR